MRITKPAAIGIPGGMGKIIGTENISIAKPKERGPSKLTICSNETWPAGSLRTDAFNFLDSTGSNECDLEPALGSFFRLAMKAFISSSETEVDVRQILIQYGVKYNDAKIFEL